MSEPEAQTTPYMANRLNSLDQTVAKDIWLDWDDADEDESDVEKYADGDCDNPTFPVRIKEEPRSPSPSVPIESDAPDGTKVKTEPQDSPSPEEDSEAYNEFQVAADAEIDMPPMLADMIDDGEDNEDDDDEDDESAANPAHIVDEDTDNYNCHFCFRGFTYKEELKDHVNMTHSMSMVLRCDLCLVNFKHKQDYFYHMNQHQTERNLRCDRCLINFRSERKFTEHVLDKHFSGSKYLCEYCDSLFSYKEDLLSHKFEEHTGLTDGYRCDTCCVSFKRKTTLETHMKSVHIQSYKCRVCKIVLSSREAFKQHNKMHSRTDRRKFLCNSCGSRFHAERTLALHRLVCLGRRVDSLAFMPVPEEYRKHPSPERVKGLKNTNVPKENEEDLDPTKKSPVFKLSNVAKVVYDGTNLVTLHKPQAYAGVSEMLIGSAIDPSETVAKIMTPVMSQELETEALKINNMKSLTVSPRVGVVTFVNSSSKDSSSSVPQENNSSTSDPNSELTETQRVNPDSSQSKTVASRKSRRAKSVSSNRSADNLISSNTPVDKNLKDSLNNTSLAEDSAVSNSSLSHGDSNMDINNAAVSESSETDEIPSLKSSGANCDSSPSEGTGSVLLDSPNVESVSKGNLGKSSVSSSNVSLNKSKVKIVSNTEAQPSCSKAAKTKVLPTNPLIKVKPKPTTRVPLALAGLGMTKASQKSGQEEEKPMTIAEIMESCEAVSAAVRDYRKRDSSVVKTENGEDVIPERNWKLPERCIKSMREQNLPRLMKKPRLMSENISQALSCRVYADSDSFKCDVCKMEFTYKFDMLRHKRTHAAAFKCDKCPAAFIKKEELAQHTLSTHFRRSTGVRSGAGLLNLFSDKMTKPRPTPVVPPPVPSDQIFSCDNCDANFGYAHELAYHMQIHGSEFKCNKCKASFREKSELAKHMLSIHF